MSRDKEHGTTRSYIIGYILSLIFTFVPYYLVTHDLLSKNVLLDTILAIAFMQMLVQIIFFLHLGRGPKPLYNVFFFIFTGTTVLFVVIASIWIIHHLNYNMAAVDVSKNLINEEGIAQIDGKQTGACQQTYENRVVTISNGVVTPTQTNAKLCDTLTFIEQDNATHDLTFGPSDHHVAYAGQLDLPLRKGKNQTITLSETGTYIFRDDTDTVVLGTFTVTQ